MLIADTCAIPCFPRPTLISSARPLPGLVSCWRVATFARLWPGQAATVHMSLGQGASARLPPPGQGHLCTPPTRTSRLRTRVARTWLCPAPLAWLRHLSLVRTSLARTVAHVTSEQGSVRPLTHHHHVACSHTPRARQRLLISHHHNAALSAGIASARL